MYARSITFMGEPEKIDSGIAFVRDEVQPKVTEMDGCLGMSMLVNRESGHCIVASAWRDQESMQASEQGTRAMRDRGGEIMGGEPRREEWEIALMHRVHDAPQGAWCRVTWLQLDHGEYERGMEAYRTQVLPRIEPLDGFCSASMLLDRTTGRLCGTVAFDSKEACVGSREQAAAVRAAGSTAAGVTVTDVTELELALAHLRVPELV